MTYITTVHRNSTFFLTIYCRNMYFYGKTNKIILSLPELKTGCDSGILTHAFLNLHKKSLVADVPQSSLPCLPLLPILLIRFRAQLLSKYIYVHMSNRTSSYFNTPPPRPHWPASRHMCQSRPLIGWPVAVPSCDLLTAAAKGER